jgi:heme-degrading monooxygenase HmoA
MNTTRGSDLTRNVDEAEGVTVMVSEWLELDATDDWVRHDAEIVRGQAFL